MASYDATAPSPGLPMVGSIAERRLALVTWPSAGDCRGTLGHRRHTCTTSRSQQDGCLPWRTLARVRKWPRRVLCQGSQRLRRHRRAACQVSSGQASPRARAVEHAEGLAHERRQMRCRWHVPSPGSNHSGVRQAPHLRHLHPGRRPRRSKRHEFRSRRGHLVPILARVHRVEFGSTEDAGRPPRNASARAWAA